MTTLDEQNPPMAEERISLHHLIDSLRAEDVPTAQRILEALNATSDSLMRKLLTVPWDDEPETEEERAAVAEARRELEEGKAIPHDEAMRRLGLA